MEEIKKLTQAQIDAYQKFYEKRDVEGHPANVFFGMLQGADPRIQKVMANKAAVLLESAGIISQEIEESEKSPKKKEEMLRGLQKAAVRMQSSVVNAPPPKDVE